MLYTKQFWGNVQKTIIYSVTENGHTVYNKKMRNLAMTVETFLSTRLFI